MRLKQKQWNKSNKNNSWSVSVIVNNGNEITGIEIIILKTTVGPLRGNKMYL